MKKIFLVFSSLFLVLSTQTIAKENQCFLKITNGGSLDTRSFTLNLDEYELRDFGPDHLSNAIQIVRISLKSVGCAKKDVNFSESAEGPSRSYCELLRPSREDSRVCYVECNLGYFFVTWDMTTHANVVFNRWD